MRRISWYLSPYSILSTVLVLGVACSPLQVEPEISGTTTVTQEIIASYSTITSPAILETISPTSEASPTFTPTQEIHATPALLPAPPSSETVDAMLLFFPTIIPEGGAEFRPPIYPVPWALTPHDHFYFVWPIAATYKAAPVWDYRYGGIYFGPDVIHTGIDLPAPRDTEVMAAGPGTVVWAGYGLYTGVKDNTDDPFGLAVAIRHDFGYQGQPLFTIYAHMAEVDVVLGQWVNTGDMVGNVGETGLTTGPHLHFEVRLGENDFWETRNPELWLAPPQGYGVIAGRVMSTYGTVLDSYLVTIKSLATGSYTATKTYAALNVHRDEYYQENVVVGGLPEGLYEINIPYGALNRIVTVQVLPGQVTFFNFYGFTGFDFGDPVSPTPSP